MKRHRCVSVVALVVLAATASVSRAGLITPSGLNPGDSFRFVFVTSTPRDAESANITDYDAFVTTAATAAGITAYGGSPVTWQVIGSTPTVNAIDRLSNDSPALYRLDGIQVATSGSDLWDGSISNPIEVDEYGGLSASNVATGTSLGGYASSGTEFGGTSNQVTCGSSWSTDAGWISGYVVDRSYPYLYYYAVSSNLTAVPEPNTFLLMSSGALAGLYWWRRRK